MAKIEAGQFVQRRIPTDIRQIIEESVSLMEPRAKEQGIELSCCCIDLKPVHADPKNMEEIFNNLISNAINYSPEGGKVQVTANGQGEYVEIRVVDTGVGISSEELPKIFDKFYRVKHPKTRRVIGTGLGLAIVKGGRGPPRNHRCGKRGGSRHHLPHPTACHETGRPRSLRLWLPKGNS